MDTAIRTKTPDVNVVFMIPATPLFIKKERREKEKEREGEGEGKREGKREGKKEGKKEGGKREEEKCEEEFVNVGPGLPLMVFFSFFSFLSFLVSSFFFCDSFSPFLSLL